MNEDLLMTWKEIATYLKCSVRKAQRLEREQLPVKRIPNTKAVWVSKEEIDQWLNKQSTHVAEIPKRQPRLSQFRFPGQLWILALGFLLTVTAAMLLLSYSRLPDSVYTRTFAGLFLIAGLSYAIAATSLPDVLSGAVNMSTLPPAFAYPFVIGLRRIPIPILLCASLIVAKHRNLRGFDSPRVRASYVIAGGFLIGVTALLGLSEMHAIWRQDLPIRWTMLTGELFIGIVNLVLLALGYRFFSSPRSDDFYRFTAQCGIACLLIALTAAINNRHWIEITRLHLDILHPETFKVHNPQAATISGSGLRTITEKRVTTWSPYPRIRSFWTH
jgi:hypothetical protein